jgi:hypothetical protein
VWRDKIFDARDIYFLLRNHTAFERCTGNFDHIVGAYHLQANDVGTGIGKKTLSKRKRKKRHKTKQNT